MTELIEHISLNEQDRQDAFLGHVSFILKYFFMSVFKPKYNDNEPYTC
jgi:hypothetical protein